MSWIKFTKDIFVITVFTVFLLIILNLFSIIVYDVYTFHRTSDRYSSLPKVVQENYSHLKKNDVNSLLEETWAPGWVYEEMLGFKEKPRHGNFVNVNSFGFRTKVEGVDFRKLLNESIWFFGGSTTFGYGVSDSETIPFILGEMLEENVINLGRGYYYSLQENLLLDSLLNSGFKPSRIIFLDGVNERCLIKTYQAQMGLLFSKAQRSIPSLSDYTLSVVKPLLAFLSKVIVKFGFDPVQQNQNVDLQYLKCNPYGNNISLSKVLEMSLNRRKDICESHNLNCITFLQPIPGVHGIHLDYAQLNEESRIQLKKKFEHLYGTFKSSGAVDITASLNSLDKHAFVDGLHYSFDANRLIAAELRRTLDGLL